MVRFLLLAGCTTILSGCLALAAAAVAGGVVYATSDDSSETVVERPWSSAFSAAVAEVASQGHVELSDQNAGVVEGHVGTASVRVKLSKSTENSVKVHVRARKLEGLAPEPDTAERIAFGIVRRLGY